LNTDHQLASDGYPWVLGACYLWALLLPGKQYFSSVLQTTPSGRQGGQALAINHWHDVHWYKPHIYHKFVVLCMEPHAMQIFIQIHWVLSLCLFPQPSPPNASRTLPYLLPFSPALTSCEHCMVRVQAYLQSPMMRHCQLCCRSIARTSVSLRSVNQHVIGLALHRLAGLPPSIADVLASGCFMKA
jgi:hypothetical protein